VTVLLLLVDTWFGEGKVLGPLELQTLDWRFRLRGPERPGDEVVLVLADDATVAALGAWPVPRPVLAEAVRRLTADGARLIVLNLLLAESQSAA
jgi:adenylate cyclase